MQGPREGTVWVVQFSLGVGMTSGSDVHNSLWSANKFASVMRERGFKCRVIEFVTTMTILQDEITAARKAETAEIEN